MFVYVSVYVSECVCVFMTAYKHLLSKFKLTANGDGLVDWLIHCIGWHVDEQIPEHT